LKASLGVFTIGSPLTLKEVLTITGQLVFSLNFLINLRINEVGVTTKKNTKPITIGETIRPKIIPNLNQILFKGESILEFNNPKIKKNELKIIDQILTLSLLSNGYNATIKNTIEKTIPKLLLDHILIFLSSIN